MDYNWKACKGKIVAWKDLSNFILHIPFKGHLTFLILLLAIFLVI
jgi:hypothetical protein